MSGARDKPLAPPFEVFEVGLYQAGLLAMPTERAGYGLGALAWAHMPALAAALVQPVVVSVLVQS